MLLTLTQKAPIRPLLLLLLVENCARMCRSLSCASTSACVSVQQEEFFVVVVVVVIK